ncbi:MAG: hypothetical protein ACNYWU_10520 [Desulfobacterales bacterium]
MIISTGPIESFFKDPLLEPSLDGDGILYHLRRDLIQIYGAESASNVFANTILASIGILAGLDYLSQAYSKYQKPKESRKRFVESVQALCNNVSNDDAESLYQLRCSLVHSIALSTVSTSYRKGHRFTFDITDVDSALLIQKISDSGTEVHYTVSFTQLKKAFLVAINRLKRIACDVSDFRNAHVINRIGQMHSEKILKAL